MPKMSPIMLSITSIVSTDCKEKGVSVNNGVESVLFKGIFLNKVDIVPLFEDFGYLFLDLGRGSPFLHLTPCLVWPARMVLVHDAYHKG